MKVVTKLMYRGRTFFIVLDKGYYLAVEDKYIDENGRTNVALNGFQLNVDKTLQGCLNKTKMCVEYDYQLQIVENEEVAMNKAISEIYR